MDHSEADYERGDWEFDQRADRRGDAERRSMEVQHIWCTCEDWIVQFKNGPEIPVRVRYAHHGNQAQPPTFAVDDRLGCDKDAFRRGLAAIEAVEAKLEEERAMMEAADYYTAGLGMELTTDKVEAKLERAGVPEDMTCHILALLKRESQDSRSHCIIFLLSQLDDEIGIDLEMIQDCIQYCLETGTWRE